MIWDGLFLPFFVEPAKHLQRLWSDRQYRSYCLLATRFTGCSRYSPREVRLHGKVLSVPDVASFLSTYRELFVEQIYRFEFPGGAPRILDLGSNVGLSVIYFKHIFPGASITAYEADPAIFAYLQKNIRSYGFDGVELRQGAVWHEDGCLRFQSEGSDGGRIAAESEAGMIYVPAFDIRTILRSGTFDVLKMDIEGAEGSVVQACRGLLDDFRFVFVEYHSSPDQPQQLHSILNVLGDAGFRYYIESVHHVSSPFYSRPVYGGYDMQLNIFAWRDTSC